MKIVETKVVDGYVTGLSATDLIALATNKGDLRGVAHNGIVYLGSAYDEFHFGIRNRLGIPVDRYEWDDDAEEELDVPNFGFNFYVASLEAAAHHEHDPTAEDGRTDWFGNEPNFQVGPLGIWCDVEDSEAMTNRQFARMVKTVEY